MHHMAVKIPITSDISRSSSWFVFVPMSRYCYNICMQSQKLGFLWTDSRLRAALHLEAGPIRCVRGLKSSLVIGQKAQIGPKHKLWNYWGLCWQIDVTPPLFIVIWSEMLIVVSVVVGAISPYCPIDHINFPSTSGCEIVEDATMAGCQVVHTNFSACSTCLLWCTIACLAVLPPKRGCQSVGYDHLWRCHIARLDGDGPPWTSVWETNPTTENALSVLVWSGYHYILEPTFYIVVHNTRFELGFYAILSKIKFHALVLL
jgi:hypothetical protein